MNSMAVRRSKIADKAPRDVFSARVEELDREGLDLDKRLDALSKDITMSEKARQKLDSIKVQTQEIEKQLDALNKRKAENNSRRLSLKDLQQKKEDAEKKASTRKADLKKYSNMDEEIARIAFYDEPTSNLDAARRANLAHAFRAIDIGREEVTEH